MKLLFIQDSLGTGGAERSNAELWYFLREKENVEIKVVVLEHRKVGIEKEILSNGFDVTFLKSGAFLSQVNEIKTIIKTFKPDIVHTVLFRSVIRVRMAKLFLNFFHIESLVNCNYSPIRYKDPKINSTGLTFYKYINRYTESWGTDLFIALTEEVKTHAIDHLKIYPEKIKVIPRGRQENHFLDEKEVLREKVRKEFSIPEEGVIFVHVGRQEYQKGHITLLEAIKDNEQELKKLNCYFLFCGRKGNASPEIEQFMIDHPMEVELFWLGHRDDINKLLVASDIFVFPSLFEGLGGALIEAQAAGLPVICSDIAVFEEVVEKDSNALFFKVEDHNDLSHKLLVLAQSRAERKEMGQKSITNFKKRFRIKDIHDRMFNIYKDNIV